MHSGVFLVGIPCAVSDFDTIESAMLSFRSQLVEILSRLGMLLKRYIGRSPFTRGPTVEPQDQGLVNP